MSIEKCPVCSGNVRVVGNTTKHYEPIRFEDRLLEWIQENKEEMIGIDGIRHSVIKVVEGE